MGNHVPNFDAMSSEDLEQWMQSRVIESVVQAAHVFPARPHGYVAHYTRLLMYARHKRQALACRLQGKILTALAHEARCDRLYQELPDYARW